MNTFLIIISLILVSISAVVAIGGIIGYAITIRQDKKFWANEMRVWEKSSCFSEHVAITKPSAWLKQHNDGPNPCDDQYPVFTLRDFSDGISLVICRKEHI